MDKEVLTKIAEQFQESSQELNALTQHLGGLTAAFKAINESRDDIRDSVHDLDSTLDAIKEAAAKIEQDGGQIIQQVNDAYPRLDQYQGSLNTALSRLREVSDAVDKLNETIMPATERFTRSLTELKAPIESLSGDLKGHKEQLGNLKGIVADSTAAWETIGAQSSAHIRAAITSIENHTGEMTAMENRIRGVSSTFEEIRETTGEIGNALGEIVMMADSLDLSKYDDLRGKVKLLRAHMDNVDKAAARMEDLSNLLQRVSAWDFKTEVDSVGEAIESLRTEVKQAREQHQVIRSDYDALRGEIAAGMATQIDLKAFLESLTQSGRDQTAFFEELCNQWASKNLRPKAMKAVNASFIQRIFGKLTRD